MNPIARRLLAVAAAATVTLGACGRDGNDRSTVVGDLVSTNVPERYDGLAASADSLVDAVDDWCASGEPGGDTGSLDEGIADVRDGWVALSPFWFGPVMDRRSRFVIDPTARADDVAALVEADDPVDAVALRETVGADQRGLGALEVLADLADDVRGRRICSYALGNARLVAEETAALAEDWASFGPTLDDSEEVADDTLGEMVNQARFALATLMTDEEQDTATARLAGIRWALIGPPGPSTAPGDDDGSETGIAVLLGDEVVEQLDAEFRAAETSIDDDTIDALLTTIETNVVSTLGLSIQFSDADGDG